MPGGFVPFWSSGFGHLGPCITLAAFAADGLKATHLDGGKAVGWQGCWRGRATAHRLAHMVSQGANARRVKTPPKMVAPSNQTLGQPLNKREACSPRPVATEARRSPRTARALGKAASSWSVSRFRPVEPPVK